MRPRFSPVSGFVDSVADRQVRPMQSFAAADVDHVRIRNRNRDRTDGSRRLIVEDWLPGPAVIGCFENTAVDLREIKHIRLRGNTAHRADSPTTKRPDV